MLIDTHAHADLPCFDDGIWACAWHFGVHHVVLMGYQARYFDRLYGRMLDINAKPNLPQAHAVLGLHPLYIDEHSPNDLALLHDYITDPIKTHQKQSGIVFKKYAKSVNYHPPSTPYFNHHYVFKNHIQVIGIGEIGLDYFYPHLKAQKNKQIDYFCAQLALAKQYQLPINLHLRKSHADALAILKRYYNKSSQITGIAHAFSGGVQEALAFCDLGFFIGITAQITNPNAKKLHACVRAVYDKYGNHFVLESDCPDFLPFNSDLAFNTPKTLTKTLDALANILGKNRDDLAKKLWHNSHLAYGGRL